MPKSATLACTSAGERRATAADAEGLAPPAPVGTEVGATSPRLGLAPPPAVDAPPAPRRWGDRWSPIPIATDAVVLAGVTVATLAGALGGGVRPG